MSIIISPNPTKNNIRVGYIDPELGYIENVSVKQANKYAKNNPGTSFIFTDGGNNVNYLNINQVNELTGQELLPIELCEGIVDKPIKEPFIRFSGGGGIGAFANAVLGEDGSILAVDLEYGGNGYQYPPTVFANDFSGSGSGAVFRVILDDGTSTDGGGTVLDCSALDQISEDYFDFEDDIEDFGRVYSLNGQDVGPWEPTSYLYVAPNNVQAFIDALNAPPATSSALNAAPPSNPVWNTRRNKPNRIVSTTPYRVNASIPYNVSDSRWSNFLNKYAISPIPSSNVPGSDHPGLYVFEWENNFPTTGQYIFRGCADNQAILYIDNIKQAALQGFTGTASPISTPTITQGIHKIRIDVLNETAWSNNYQPIKYINFGLFKNQHTVFNTVDFIDKANRTLWRANPYGRGGLLSSHGICPFDNVNLVAGENYVGTHTIVWENVRFPQSREYLIRIEVDDSVVLKIGDSIVISKTGTRTLDRLQNIPQGKYNITAELTQRALQPGDGPFKNVNPMALAIDISIPTLVSPRTDLSYKINPVAVSMSIDYPKPTPVTPVISAIPEIPVTLPPPQEGPCPPNPFWSTRFPNSSERWYPAIFPTWSKFTNLYAISPVPPLNSGGDGAGIVFRNSWTIDAPYSGEYGFRGTVDNIGKFFVDGKEIARLQGFDTKRPETIRFNLSEGVHTVEIEVENIPLPGSLPTPPLPSNVLNASGAGVFTPSNPRRIANRTTYDLTYRLTIRDYKSEDLVNVTWNITGQGDIGTGFRFTFTEENVGRNSRHSFTIGEASVDRPNKTEVRRVKPNVNYRVRVTSDGGRVQDDPNKPFVDRDDFPGIQVGTLEEGKRDFKQLRNALVTNKKSNAAFADAVVTKNDSNDIRIVAFSVDIPVKPPTPPTPRPPTPWGVNPIGVSAVIIACCPKRAGGKGVVIEVIPEEPGNKYGIGTPGTPGGGGSSTGGGTGGDGSSTGGGTGGGTTYPVSLELEEVIIKNPGISYCPEDSITITPDNGAELAFETDNFGRIVNVNVLNSGFGFTTYPTITIFSPVCGGVNAKFIPKFRIIRDPIVVDESKLIQVTDLVGIKQTGYIDGRPYFGAVFYKNNIKYAGYYETVGDLVQVYDTLKESIDAQVTTPPSAIQRQGTDVTSNDPRLNIPGTPQNLI